MEIEPSSVFSCCVAEHRDSGGAILRVPKCCYLCHQAKNSGEAGKTKCTLITKENAVLLSCRCDLAVCQPCALNIVTQQSETFMLGVTCPGCNVATKDVFMPRILNNDAPPASTERVADSVEKSTMGAFKHCNLMGNSQKNRKQLSDLYDTMRSRDDYAAAASHLMSVSVEEFCALSPAQQSLLVARAEACRAGTPDPLSELKFLRHTSLLTALGFASGEEPIAALADSKCYFCWEAFDKEKIPVQHICPNGCKQLLCRQCAPDLLNRQELSKLRGESSNNYEYVTCCICRELVSLFLNSDEAQNLENSLLSTAVGSLLPTGRKNLRNEFDYDSKRKPLYEKFKDMGLLEKLGLTPEYDILCEQKNVKLEFVRIIHYFLQHPCEKTSRHMRSRREHSQKPEGVSEIEPVYPTLDILIPKPDMFYEKLLTFYDLVVEHDSDLCLPRPYTQFSSCVTDTGSIYAHSSEKHDQYRWFTLVDAAIVLDSTDTSDVSIAQALSDLCDGSSRLKFCGVLKLVDEVPAMEEVMMEIIFTDLMFNVNPDCRGEVFQPHQLGICVAPLNCPDCRVVLEMNESEANEVTAAIYRLRACYVKLFNYVVKKSRVLDNCDRKLSVNLTAETAGGTTGMVPLLGVLSPDMIAGCGVGEGLLLRLMCRFFILSETFYENCPFMDFCRKTVAGLSEGPAVMSPVPEFKQAEDVDETLAHASQLTNKKRPKRNDDIPPPCRIASLHTPPLTSASSSGATNAANAPKSVSTITMECQNSDRSNHVQPSDISTDISIRAEDWTSRIHTDARIDAITSSEIELLRKFCEKSDLETLAATEVGAWKRSVALFYQLSRGSRSPQALCIKCKIGEAQMKALLRQSGLRDCSMSEPLFDDQYRTLYEYVATIPAVLQHGISTGDIKEPSSDAPSAQQTSRAISAAPEANSDHNLQKLNYADSNEMVSIDTIDTTPMLIDAALGLAIDDTAVLSTPDFPNRADMKNPMIQHILGRAIAALRCTPSASPSPSPSALVRNSLDPRLSFLAGMQPKHAIPSAGDGSDGGNETADEAEDDSTFNQEEYTKFLEELLNNMSGLENVKTFGDLVDTISGTDTDCSGCVDMRIPEGCLAPSNPITTVLQRYLQSEFTKLFDTKVETLDDSKAGSSSEHLEYPFLRQRLPNRDVVVGTLSTMVFHSLHEIFFRNMYESFFKYTELSFIADVIPELVDLEVTHALNRICLCHFYFYDDADADNIVYFLRIPMKGFPVVRIEDKVTNRYIDSRAKDYNSSKNQYKRMGFMENKMYNFQRLFPIVPGGELGGSLSELAVEAREFIKQCVVSLRLDAIRAAKQKINSSTMTKTHHKNYIDVAPVKLAKINELVSQKEKSLARARKESKELDSILKSNSEDGLDIIYQYDAIDTAMRGVYLKQRFVFLMDEIYFTELELSDLKNVALQQIQILKLVESKRLALQSNPKANTSMYNKNSDSKYNKYQSNFYSSGGAHRFAPPVPDSRSGYSAKQTASGLPARTSAMDSTFRIRDADKHDRLKRTDQQPMRSCGSRDSTIYISERHETATSAATECRGTMKSDRVNATLTSASGLSTIKVEASPSTIASTVPRRESFEGTVDAKVKMSPLGAPTIVAPVYSPVKVSAGAPTIVAPVYSPVKVSAGAPTIVAPVYSPVKVSAGAPTIVAPVYSHVKVSAEAPVIVAPVYSPVKVSAGAPTIVAPVYSPVKVSAGAPTIVAPVYSPVKVSVGAPTIVAPVYSPVKVSPPASVAVLPALLDAVQSRRPFACRDASKDRQAASSAPVPDSRKRCWQDAANSRDQESKSPDVQHRHARPRREYDGTRDDGRSQSRYNHPSRDPPGRGRRSRSHSGSRSRDARRVKGHNERASRSRSPTSKNRLQHPGSSFSHCVKEPDHRRAPTEAPAVKEYLHILDASTTSDAAEGTAAANSFEALRGKYTTLTPELAAILNSKPQTHTEKSRPKHPPKYFSKERQLDYKHQKKMERLTNQEKFNQLYKVAGSKNSAAADAPGINF